MREPTEAELAAMNNEPLLSAHEEDAVHFGPVGDKIVQVRIAGAPAKRTYAYSVPREVDAAMGDWVSLPGNVVNEHGGFGVVKDFGRQGYNGPLKNIVAVIPEPHELEIRMSVVKTRSSAAEIYDQAVALGWSAEQLTSLATIGQDRLKARGVQ